MPKSLFRASAAAFFIMLFCAWAFGKDFFPNHSFVYLHNQGLQTAGSEKAPPPGMAASNPSDSNPFSNAYVRVLSAMPSVDSRISSLHPPSILWIWGAGGIGQLRHEVQMCDLSIFIRTPIYNLSAGSPSFMGKAVFSLPKNYSETVFGLQGGLIKTPPGILEHAEVLQGNGSEPALPTLNVRISGRVRALFLEEGVNCTSEAAEGGSGCRCAQIGPRYSWMNSTELSDEKNWSVEVGTPFVFLLSPISREQLTYKPKIGAIVFSSHEAAQITLLYNGEELNSSYLAEFSQEAGYFGELRVASVNTSIYGAVLSGTPAGNYSGIPATIAVTRGTKFLRPSSLTGTDTAYAYQYLVQSNSSLPPGNGTLSVYFRTHFDDTNESSYRTLARDAAIIVVNESGAAAYAIDWQGKRRKISGVDAASSNSAGGNLSYYSIAGNDSMRPASSSKYSPTPNFTSLFFGSMIFSALFGLWLYRFSKD